jgi:proline iminopeptidase
MKVDEGYIEVPGGRVWYRAVGEQTEAIPLLCLHGGPGFTHYYLEPLETLAEHRRVIFYDQLGCGRSDSPDDISLWTVDRFVSELVQVRKALGLDRLHLFGSSWGGMLAMQYTLDRKPDLESLTLCGSPASMLRWVSDCDELLAAEPVEVRQVIREHEAAGFTACPEYQSAILGFYRKHVCRLRPWPAGPGTLLRRGRLRGLQHDERPERVHRYRHPEDLGHHGSPGRDHRSDAAGGWPL